MALEVLVVDDEADIRELVSGVLEDEGYEVRSAADSTAALEAIDEIDQALGLERFFDEVDGALADRGDRRVEIAVAGNQQHRQAGVAALDLLQQLQPVEPRALQPHVEQHHRRPPLADCIEGGGTVCGGAHRIAFVFEDSADQLADVRFIVDDQNFKCHQSTSSTPAPSPCPSSSAPGSSPSPPSEISFVSCPASKAMRTCVPPPARSRKAISP